MKNEPKPAITESLTATANSRESFRIDHDVLLEYKIVEAYAAQHSTADIEFPSSQDVNLLVQLKRIDKVNQQALQLLSEKNRLLGDYLHSMSEKIDLIAQHIAFNNDHDSHQTQEKNKNNREQHKKTRINLSEDGLSFSSNRALYQGNYLALHVTFLPSYTTITTFATIVRCEPHHEQYKIAVQFYKLTEASRQEIAREIFKAQISNKPSQR